MIREGWESAETPDYFERLFRGLEACQLGLRQWSHDIHNNPRTRIDKLKQQLSDLAMGEQTEQTRKEGEELRAELEKVYSDEDIFWRQRSKISWAREGDRNTSFSMLGCLQENLITPFGGYLIRLGDGVRRRRR